MFRNRLFPIALLMTLNLCATLACAQSGTRSNYSAPAFPSGSSQSSQPQSRHYQASGISSTWTLPAVTYSPRQTCANGTCSMRSGVSPVVSPATGPIIDHSTHSISQYPVAVGSTQPTYNAYYPAPSSVYYPSYTLQYGATKSPSSTPISSCSGAGSSSLRSYR